MMTRLWSEALARMEAVSSISAMKVDTPRAWESAAPTRARIPSHTYPRAVPPSVLRCPPSVREKEIEGI